MVHSGTTMKTKRKRLARRNRQLISTSLRTRPEDESRILQSKKDKSTGSDFVSLSQNVNGLKRPEKIDAIVHTMRRRKIDVYLVQETWLEGDGEEYKHITIHNYTVFFHGNPEKTCDRGRGGVAIFLSPRAAKAWEAASAHKPKISGNVAGCPRWMSIELRTFFELKPRNITFISAYHPSTNTDDDEIEEFYEKYPDFVQEITNNDKTHLVIGCDANAQIGNTDTCPADSDIIGKYGDPRERSTPSCKMFKEFMHKCNLRANITDFQHKRYDTCYCAGFNTTTSIDHFLTSPHLKSHREINNAGRVGYGIGSDHAAIRLSFILKLRTKTKKSAPKPTKKRP